MRVVRKQIVVALVAAALLPARDAAAGAGCLTSSGRTACGFHCDAGYGQVRCAQTEQGTCAHGSDMVVCWDPPALLRRIWGDGVPRPSCVTAGGQMACGYKCLTGYERPQCAQTPFGACGANEGKVVCWDPPGQVVAQMKARTPTGRCESAYGKVACGYSCAAYDGEVRCSQTPVGFCRVQQRSLVCWDPPLESLPGVLEPGSELACMDAAGGRTCGYRCLTGRSLVRCGGERREYCRMEEEGIECSAP